MNRHKRKIKRIAGKICEIYGIKPKSYSDGIALCHCLHSHGVLTTIGKFSSEGDDPIQIAHEYIQCSNSFINDSIEDDFYLSLKPPALHFRATHVRKIEAVAFNNGHGIHFDSHDHILAEPTFRMLKQQLAQNGTSNQGRHKWRYGVTLPSRWKRSIADARWAAKNNVRVRLVKGEFKAVNTSEEMDPKKGFLKLIDNLSGSGPDIAIATHDVNLAKTAIQMAKKAGNSIQLELLFGMPAAGMIDLAKTMKVPLRFYIAYGDMLLLYGIRHLITTCYKLFRPGILDVFDRTQSKLLKIIKTL